MRCSSFLSTKRFSQSQCVIEVISMRSFFHPVPWRKIQIGTSINRYASSSTLALIFFHRRTTASFSTMLSQLKAREVTPAPEEPVNQVDKNNKKSKMSDAEQQAARLTCDALCSLANGITGPTSPPTPNAATPSVPTLGAHGFLYRSATEPVAVPLPPKPAPTLSSPAKTVPIRGTTNKNATAKTSTKIVKQHQLPLFLSSKFLVIDSVFP